MYSKNKKKCLIAALHSGQLMPMLEEKQSADVWCQCEVDANWQLYRKNALLSDGLTGRTPKPDILYMFNASDLGAIGRKKKRKKTLLDIYAWLLVCRKKKNVPPKSKWAQKCKADSVFFPLCQRYWWCTVDLLLLHWTGSLLFFATAYFFTEI